LLNLLKVSEWNNVPTIPNTNPTVNGIVGLLYISAEELKAIPP